MIRSEKCIYYFFIGNQWCLTIRQLSGPDACVHQLTIFLNQAKRYKMIHQIVAWQILWIHNLQNRTLITYYRYYLLLQVLPTTTDITYYRYYLLQILPAATGIFYSRLRLTLSHTKACHCQCNLSSDLLDSKLHYVQNRWILCRLEFCA